MGSRYSLCCCFCCNDDELSTSSQQPAPHSRYSTNGPSFTPYEYRAMRNGMYQAATSGRCDVCGITVDPVLLEGHREVCRTNHRRAMVLPMKYADSNCAKTDCATINKKDGLLCGGTESYNEDELCVVCFTHPRCYAFLPCGHVSCCFECAKALDTCPLCRQPRASLCYVAVDVFSRYRCKHCDNFIVPTLFEGHREVCSLQQRKLIQDSQAAVEEVTVDTDAALALPTASKELSLPEPRDEAILGRAQGTTCLALTGKNMCLECSKVAVHLFICLPCGHRVLCAQCAKGRTTCPVCLQEISETVAVYD